MSKLAYAGTVRRLAIAAAIGLATAMGSGASAQFGEAAGIAEAMQPDYFKRDVVLISQGLKLDETQRVIVNTMFDDYQSAFDEGIAQMKGRFDSMRSDLVNASQQEILRKVFEPFRDWAGEKQKLGTKFLANIEVVLTPDQLQLWPAVQRRLYRERNLHKGRLSGETLNLVDVVRDMHLDARVSMQIQPLVEAYEIALDRALHNREDPLSGSDNPMLQSLQDQDPGKGQKALEAHIHRQIEVRNVNDQYIEQIAQALPGDLGAQFHADALERAYPRVYRETPVQRIFKVADDLQGLDSGTKQSISALEQEFLTELTTTNQKLLAALRDYEPAEALDRASDFAKRMAGEQVEPKPDPTRDLFLSRDDMSRGYIKRLKELLTEDQFALLPGAYRWLEPQPVQPEPVSNKPKERVKGMKSGTKYDTP